MNPSFHHARYFSVSARKTTRFGESSLTSCYLLLDAFYYFLSCEKSKGFFIKSMHMDKRHWFWQNRNEKKLDS